MVPIFDAPRHVYAALGIAACLSLAAVYAGESWQWSVLAGCVLLAVWSLWKPSVGLLAALPLIQIIHPTPITLGWREIVFSTILLIASLSSLWHGRQLLLQNLRHFYKTGLCIIIVLLLNAITAYYHDVGIKDWFRGLIPFLMILYFLPTYLELKRDKRFLESWIFALIIASALFSLRVVSTFVSDELWKPDFWILDGETLKRVGHPIPGAFIAIYRVTFLVQQATDVLLPIGGVVGAWMVLFGKRRIQYFGGTALLVLSTVAITMTYTRSMLGACVLVIGGLCLFSGMWRRACLVVIFTVLPIVSTMFLAGLENTYLNRFASIKQTASYTKSTDKKINIADTSIVARMQEYSIAWGKFLNAPILGEGLGTKYHRTYMQDDNEVHLYVGFIHNWVFYFLMVGGLVGIFGYTLVLTGPVLMTSSIRSIDKPFWMLIVAVVSVMGIYGLFFAVFRLISFNLILGGIWAIVFSKTLKGPQSRQGLI